MCVGVSVGRDEEAECGTAKERLVNQMNQVMHSHNQEERFGIPKGFKARRQVRYSVFSFSWLRGGNMLSLTKLL